MTLVVMGSTTSSTRHFRKYNREALEEDAEKFGAEYLCRWRDDLTSMFGRDLLDAAVDIGVIVRPPVSSIRYVAGCDASGGRNDSFTAAIAHREHDGKIVLDLTYERKPPFNPSEVVAEIVALMREYRCRQITGDKYAAGWVVEAFQKAGARYIQSDRDRQRDLHGHIAALHFWPCTTAG